MNAVRKFIATTNKSSFDKEKAGSAKPAFFVAYEVLRRASGCRKPAGRT